MTRAGGQPAGGCGPGRPSGAPDCYPHAVPTRSFRDRLTHPLVWSLLLGVLAVGGYLGAELYLLDGRLGFTLDDSCIHLQFARNLAAGEGLAYNPGRLVTGSTAPLWTALVSLGFLVPPAGVAWAKVAGVALYLLVIPATYRLARVLGVMRGLAALGAALVAASSWMVWGALSGMEIPLFTLLSIVGITRHVRERRAVADMPFSALFLALAALARPEGFLLLGAAFVDRLAGLAPTLRGPDRSRALRVLGLWLALAAIVVVPTMIFYRVVGDGFLPTTYAAKSPGLVRWLPSAGYLGVVVGIFFPVQPLMTLLALGGALALVADRLTGEDDRTGLLPVLWLLGLPLAYSLMSPLGPGVVVGNFGRYYFPLFPPLVVLGLLAVDRAAGPWLRAARDASRRPILVVLAALVLLPTLLNLGRGLELYTRNVLNVEDSDVAMARWLADRLPPEAVLAVNDIGALRFLLPNEVVDLAGIGNPEIRDHFAAAEREGRHWREGISSFLETERPDYLVIFPSWFPGLAERSDSFEPLHRIAIERNITMGGDELVLYSTPWTRYPLRTR